MIISIYVLDLCIIKGNKYYLQNIALFDNNPLSMPNSSYRQTNKKDVMNSFSTTFLPPCLHMCPLHNYMYPDHQPLPPPSFPAGQQFHYPKKNLSLILYDNIYLCTRFVYYKGKQSKISGKITFSRGFEIFLTFFLSRA